MRRYAAAKSAGRSSAAAAVRFKISGITCVWLRVDHLKVGQDPWIRPICSSFPNIAAPRIQAKAHNLPRRLAAQLWSSPDLKCLFLLRPRPSSLSLPVPINSSGGSVFQIKEQLGFCHVDLVLLHSFRAFQMGCTCWQDVHPSFSGGGAWEPLAVPGSL